jgi:hypothetical protein
LQANANNFAPVTGEEDDKDPLDTKPPWETMEVLNDDGSTVGPGQDEDEDLAMAAESAWEDEDEEEDVPNTVDGMVNKVQILKLLRRVANIYGPPPGVPACRPDFCVKMTAVDKSGVHKLWVKPCNCTGSENSLERHLLQLGLLPASFEKTRTVFTFAVLNDFRLTNLECQASAYHYYKKLKRMTSPLIPDAVEVRTMR